MLALRPHEARQPRRRRRCVASDARRLLVGRLRTVVSTAAAPTSVAGASGFDGAALPGACAAVPDFALSDENGARDLAVELSRQGDDRSRSSYSTCGATCTVIVEQIRGALDELAGHLPVLLDQRRSDARHAGARARLPRAGVLGARARYLTRHTRAAATDLAHVSRRAAERRRASVRRVRVGLPARQPGRERVDLPARTADAGSARARHRASCVSERREGGRRPAWNAPTGLSDTLPRR